MPRKLFDGAFVFGYPLAEAWREFLVCYSGTGEFESTGMETVGILLMRWVICKSFTNNVSGRSRRSLFKFIADDLADVDISKQSPPPENLGQDPGMIDFFSFFFAGKRYNSSSSWGKQHSLLPRWLRWRTVGVHPEDPKARWSQPTPNCRLLRPGLRKRSLRHYWFILLLFKMG